MATVNGVPEGLDVAPFLNIDPADGADRAIEFYKEVFGAHEQVRFNGPDGKVAFASIRIGNGVVMLADDRHTPHARFPREVGGTPVTISVYVPDADGAYERALAAGAKGLIPVERRFYGDRSGHFEDPFGHRWYVATHLRDVPLDTMVEGFAEAQNEGEWP